jgi:threonine dehydratase
MIIAGQGTIALEILSELPETDVLMIPLSGGGLLAGMAMVAKTINPGIHVVGISLERSPAMLESLKAGVPMQVEEKDSIADSLLGGIGFDNQYTLPMVEKFADEHVLISEDAIKDGMYYVFDKHRLIVEGGAAVGVGALMHGKINVRGQQVVILLSGSSIDSEQYVQIIKSRLPGAGKH